MTTSTSQTAFLTVEKSFSYRGAREHWANAYHFDQTPPDSAAWGALASSVVGAEMQFLPADVQFERYTGHTPGTPPVLVWESDPAPAGEGGTPGTFVPGASEYATPGDVALWMRYGTTQRNSRGKQIYLRNYYHAMFWQTTPNTPSTRQVTALNNFGASMVSGWPIAGITYRRAGPRGAVAQNHQVGAWLTTRTLKARGKRKKQTLSSSDIQEMGDLIGRLLPGR